MPFSAIVIDDEPDILDGLATLLELYGVNVLATGENGKQAAELFEKHRPDVVFCDILMPQYDGIYALRHIRMQKPDAIFVAISASIDNKYEQELAKEKPTLVFGKTYDLKKIVAAVSDTVQKNAALAN